MPMSRDLESRSETARRPAVPPYGGVIDGGLAAGVFAGLVMALAGMTLSAAEGAGFWTPMRLVAAAVLGVDALVGGFGAVLLGVFLHFCVAAFWGVVFAALVGQDTRAGRALAEGLLFGAAVWAVMTYGAVPSVDRVLAPRVALSPEAWLFMHLVYGACLWRAPELKWRHAGAQAVRARRPLVESRETKRP